MRIFIIKARDKHNKVVNSCTYLGIEKLRMHGWNVYRRYERYSNAELWELINDKWVIEPDKEKIRRLCNPYLSDITN